MLKKPLPFSEGISLTLFRLSVPQKKLPNWRLKWFLIDEICGNASCHVSRVWLNGLPRSCLCSVPGFSSSPSVCGGISMETTSCYLIHSPVPLAPGLTTVWHPRPSLSLSNCLPPPASFSFHSSLSSTADTSGWPGPISSAEPTAACRYGLSVDTVDDLLDAADHRTLVFFLHEGSPNAFFCYFPLIYAPQLWWMFWF